MGTGLLVAASVVLLGAPSAGASGAAATFTVAGFADGPGSAGCAAPDANGNSVCPTLRAAVGEASKQSNSATIKLQAGTYQLTLANGGQLDLASSMSILGTGPGGSNGTTIQQSDGQSRVLEVDGTTQLSGLEITGGHLSPPWGTGINGTALGGGILVVGTLALQDALVTGNEVVGAAGPSPGDAGDNAEGGGIAYAVGSGAGSAITDTTISGNSALAGAGGPSGSAGGNAFGGGVAYEGGGPLLIHNSTISGNAATAGEGGGGVSAGGSGGFAEGGGIWHSSDLTLTASSIISNTATGGHGGPGPGSSSGGSGSGGGIADIEALAQVVNSTVFENLAQGGPGGGGGSAGGGVGGGIYDTGSDAGAALQSDTIDGNQAASQASNLFLYVGNPPNPYTFTIHDTIVAAGQPASVASCDVHGAANPPTSESYNLEDDAAGSCGFNGASHDLVGVNPGLASALASNGGPTQTLAPAPGSPVLGAGGQCTDPTSTPPNHALTVDQRGAPRSTPCDMGAFQAQHPHNTTAPAITGMANPGATLICSQGAWTGDGSLQYAFAWLRDGSPIPGATTNSYVVGKEDPGRSLSCRVTATYYGSVAATSRFVVVPSYPLVMLLRLTVRGSRVAVDLGCRGPDGKRCRGALQLVAVEKVRGRRVMAVIGAQKPQSRVVVLRRHGYILSARHTETIDLTLNRTGSRLLERFHKLPVTVGITQTLPTGTHLVSTRLIRIRLKPRRGA